MTATINQVVLSGTVYRVFDQRETAGGLANQSFLLNFTENNRDRRVYVNAFGDVVNQMSDLDEGNYVIVQGRLTEQAWEKDGEWQHRVEIVPNRVVDHGQIDMEMDGPPDE